MTSQAHEPLGVEDLPHSLRHSSARGGALMIASHAIQLLIGITGTAILARLLRPQDFGYLAMVATLTNFVATFRDFGLPMAAVQKPQLSHEQASGLFWVNLLAGLVVAALVAAMAPVLAWFYNEPRLVGITLAMAGGVLIHSLSMVHVGLLRRRMNFTAVTALEVGAMVVGLVVGVGSAVAGAGYWALVFQQISIYVTQSAIAIVLCHWRPAARRASSSLRDPQLLSMLRYGKNVTLSRIVTYLARNIDAVLVGFRFGPATLGLYQKAYQWSMMPLVQLYAPLLPVAVSSFSRLQQEPDRYRSYVRTTLLGLFSAALPLTALIFLTAEPVILLLLGQQWTDAIPFFRILAVGAYFSTFDIVTRWLYLAEGRTGEQLRWSLISAPVMIAAVVVGLRWGAIGVASGFSTAAVLLAVPSVAYCLRRSPVGARDFLSATWRPLVASLVAGGVLALAQHWLPVLPRTIFRFLIDASVYMVAYVVCWLALPRGREEAGRMINHLRLLLPRAAV